MYLKESVISDLATTKDEANKVFYGREDFKKSQICGTESDVSSIRKHHLNKVNSKNKDIRDPRG